MHTDISPVSDSAKGIETPASRLRAARRYGLLVVLAVAVLVVSSALGNVVRSRGGASVEATVIGRCKAVSVAGIAPHREGAFNSIVIGQPKAIRHQDGCWSVAESADLSGHVVEGVKGKERVSITKTCAFSKATARNGKAPAENVLVDFDGTRGKFSQTFVLDSSGKYVFSGGDGLKNL